ncbi:uncharacterized protein EV420DRAFT_1640849 [Desarmillaria tabescens]|uniref:Uncharacterized protein n=1 Tax=Armillaria tabescens TaxID=1929756 RepID=A0AA39N970_ARMTA|nr:uncharacterized protein EV420DRAFT_1640849 [Desarmillaria tabescens]KAK0461371.1 hypothetical protein EV420DRAFT_1640849 [Desarmillaria tabescens]
MSGETISARRSTSPSSPSSFLPFGKFKLKGQPPIDACFAVITLPTLSYTRIQKRRFTTQTILTTETPSSTPELSTKTHTSTLSRLSRPVELDITLSHSRTSSVDIAFPLLSLSTFTHVDVNTATSMSIQAGLQCMSRRGILRKISQEESTSSESISDFADSLSFASISSSSMTSISTAATESSFLDEEREDETYQVQRAQTQSMEIQRGVLLTREALRASVLGPVADTPKVVISTVPVSSEAQHASLSTDASLLHVRAPSILVTHPSTSTIDSSASSMSVDLADFPLPPTPGVVPVGKLTVSKDVVTGGRLDFGDLDKRSTLEQFIMLYGSTQM